MKNPMSQRVNISFSDLILRLYESAVCGSAQSTNSVTQSSPTFSKISRQLASTFRAGPVGQKLLRNLTTNHNFTERGEYSSRVETQTLSDRNACQSDLFCSVF